MHKNNTKTLRFTLLSLLVTSFAFAYVIFENPYLSRFTASPGHSGSATLQDTLKKQGPADDSVFQVLLRSADRYEKEKNYRQGVAELEKALKLKPGNPLVKDKLSKMKALAAGDQKKSDDAAKAITSGDAYFAAKDYLNAKASYQLALDASPDNAVAKEKMKKTMDLLRSQKAQNILFDVAIASADKLFQAGDYERAKQEYENAAKLLPGDPYPKNRINEIIKIQVDKQVKDEEYARAIASADKFYGANNLPMALVDYKKAIGIKPEEKYPQTRVKEITDLLAARKAKDDAYDKAVRLGDQNFREVRYGDAIKYYRDALGVKPEQVYPKNKILEIEGLLGRIKKAQDDYDRLVNLADSLYIEKQYFKARENYLNASSVKPNESYPKEMMSKVEQMLSGQEVAMAKALEEQYAKLVASADKLFNDKSLEPARAEYVKASNLKPGESYPKEKIAAIDNIFAEALKNKDEQYRMAVEAGDKALAGKVFDIARNEYNRALSIKPAEKYPKTKLEELERLVAAEAKRKAEDSKFTNAIAAGDSLFFEKQYIPARAQFQAALDMKPSEAYPRNRIAEIDGILAELEKQKQKEAQYAALIAKADKGFIAKEYAVSKDDYKKASALKPEEMHPKERIAEIDRLLGDLAALKALDDSYKAAVAKADQLFTAKSYPESRSEYENALKIKAAETYPQGRIAEIDRILADLAAKRSADENYRAAITAADQLFDAKNWEQAKTEYQRALGIKPSEQYPKTRIAEIGNTLAALARQKSLDESYTAAVAEAEQLLGARNYAEAKVKYQGALKLKPAEQYPKDKIGEIDLALADLAKAKALDDRYDAALRKADNLLAQKSYPAAKTEYLAASEIKPSENYPKTKVAEIDRILEELAAAKALDDRYRASVASADQLLASKKYEDARAEYGNALAIKPGEAYPQGKIGEIDVILADIAAKKSLDENYQASIARADQLFASKSWDQSKAEYQKALGLKPAEAYPKSRITEIDGILEGIARKAALDQEYAKLVENADRLLDQKTYAEAKTQYQAALKLKPGEAYPAGKITEIDQALAELARLKDIDDRYQAAVKKADNLFGQKQYANAREEYTGAATIKPSESYPPARIAEIDRILGEIAAAKALDDQYRGVVAKADQLLAAKDYTGARGEYENAVKLKPAETYPPEKLAEISKILADIEAEKLLAKNYQESVKAADQLLAGKKFSEARTEYEKASGMKPAEQYPKSKITEIDGILAEIARKKALDEEYTATITAADKLLAEKSYQPAKDQYQKAGELKPAEQYPKTKIGEIDLALADIARQKSIDDQYQAAVAEADRQLLAKSYDQAKESYGRAGKIKPSENYPKEKITEIDGILAALAKQKALDDQYRAAVDKGDQLLAAKSYEAAKTEFTNASTLKPEEGYPRGKITEINTILAEIKAKEEAFNQAVAAADALLAAKKYEEARTGYQDALAIRPQADYPKEKIALINKTLEELMGKQKYYEKLVAEADDLLKGKELVKAKESYQRASGVLPEQSYPKTQITLIQSRIDSLYRANKAGYDKAVADGDRFYNNFEFDKAVDAYTEASNLLPMEAYPREMIVKIRRTIAENAIADVLKSTVTISANDEKQFAFTPVNIASRKNNFVYIKIRNLSGKPFNVLMRYGKDKQSNGGVVMRNITIDGKMNERLVSVKDQDLWSREDNNWISLIPQGGDIEVSFIQVSRAKLD